MLTGNSDKSMDLLKYIQLMHPIYALKHDSKLRQISMGVDAYISPLLPTYYIERR